MSNRSLSNRRSTRLLVGWCVMASFNVEDFSINRLSAVQYEEIRARFSEFKHLVHFEDLA